MNRDNLKKFNILALTMGERVDKMERELKTYAAKPTAVPAITKEKQELIDQLREFINTAQSAVTSEYIAGFDAGKQYAQDENPRFLTSETKELIRFNRISEVRQQWPELT